MQDEDDYFWFFSRQDDLIISSGYRIGPFEVESALIEHDAVKESAVVSSPDKDRGQVINYVKHAHENNFVMTSYCCQVVKAFVVLTDTYKHVKGSSDEERLIGELQNHVKNTTAPYKYPRKIEFVDSLPKTVSGKIRRGQLREKELKD